MYFLRSKSTLGSLKSVFNAFWRKPSLGAPESLSIVDSDDSEWNFIPGAVPNTQQNFQEEDEILAEATKKRGEAKNNASKYVIVSLDPRNHLHYRAPFVANPFSTIP